MIIIFYIFQLKNTGHKIFETFEIYSKFTTISTFLGKMEHIPIGNKCSIKTLQSLDFKPLNLRPLIDTKLLLFDEHPSGTLTS
jgi:hypothetical protein